MKLTCPHCSTFVETNFVTSESYNIEGDYVETHQCPSCKKIIFADVHHELSYDSEPYIMQIYPPKKNVRIFSDKINNLSSDFVKIYNQTEEAEAYGLNLLVGSGYRKSLEYLIKDFAIYLLPDKKDQIVNENRLSNIICNLIPNNIHFEDIKAFANRVWWLGSDEIHYYQKYDVEQLDHLKDCLNIAVNEIDYYLTKEELKTKIPKK